MNEEDITKTEETECECSCCDSNAIALLGTSLKTFSKKLTWIKTYDGTLINVECINAIWITNSTPYKVIASANGSGPFTLYSGPLDKCQEAMETLYDCFTLEYTGTVELREETGPWNPL